MNKLIRELDSPIILAFLMSNSVCLLQNIEMTHIPTKGTSNNNVSNIFKFINCIMNLPLFAYNFY